MKPEIEALDLVFFGHNSVEPILTMDEWELQTTHGGFWLRVYATWHDGHKIEGTIEKRQPYCDRGHWYFKIFGVPGLDYADSFPRYYMNLPTAVSEATLWINWRNHQCKARSPKPYRENV